jgi:hypothetical protein
VKTASESAKVAVSIRDFRFSKFGGGCKREACFSAADTGEKTGKFNRIEHIDHKGSEHENGEDGELRFEATDGHRWAQITESRTAGMKPGV